MEKRLREVLRGEEGNYILPFFWQHGESEEKLREMMGAVQDSGIGAVCVESRPHPDFVGPDWWRDMDVIMDEARNRGMRVWVLDDAHFPSGYCNGRVEDNSIYSKCYLDHYTVDAVGPQAGTSFLISLEEGEALIGVAAAKRTGPEAGALEEPIDITDHVRGNAVYWDIPEGYWNVIVIKTTFSGTGRKKYINTVDAAAVRFFLDTVYEPHWCHYKEDFGRTFAGFFSDEPELGNCCGEYGHNASIGQPDMRLPWGEELAGMVKELWGSDTVVMLAALWNRLGDMTGQARYEYMNMVTDLYGKNFCGQIGEWCDAHHVEYIGHVIEDCGTHARLGLGTGHYFKALWGQHMSGIDVVLQQIRPGYDKVDFYNIGGKGRYNGTFFHYGLAKMGVSLGHLDPKKKGRTMCEVYGAYGWTEGLKLMKWLTDHMLVRGVNWFVPHAFTGGDFPDPDCPPHFYAWGNNPQYPWFSCLCRYMNRMSHLLNGGIHSAGIALLYTAEMEWLGDYQPFEETGRLLAENQLDYEVIPLGLLETCKISGGKMLAGKEEFEVLVIPECAYIPEELAEWLLDASSQGFPVIFAGSLPTAVESGWREAKRFYGWKNEKARTDARGNMAGERLGKKAAAEWNRLVKTEESHSSVDTGSLYSCACGEESRLLAYLDAVMERDIFCENPSPYLRYYHYKHQNGDFIFFFNEAPVLAVESAITLKGYVPGTENACWYDAFDNRLEPAGRDGSGKIVLQLAPGEASVLYLGEPQEQLPPSKEVRRGRRMEMEDGWRLAFRSFQEKDFSPKTGLAEEYSEKSCEAEETADKSHKAEESAGAVSGRLYNISAAEGMEDFAGTIRYEADFEWDPERDGEMLLIDFGAVYETMEVWLNGEKKAVRIAPPYRCSITGAVKGQNRLTVYVTNTLVHKYHDFFSMTMPVEGSGLLGPVCAEGYWE